MEFKEYVVTLYKHEDLDSFYEDMETPGGNLYIPDRAVNVASRRAISRNTHYWLTDEEARQLKLDPRVWDVQPYEELDILPAWQDNNQVYSKSASNILFSDRNWGIASIFDKSFDANWGSDSTARKTASYQSKVDGLNVDFVIFGRPFDYAQPEFAVNEDGTGGTRYRYTDWHSFLNSEINAELTSRGLNPSHYAVDLLPAYTDKTVNYLYNVYKPYNLESSIFHESVCASIILGNRQGLSRRANFYIIDDPVQVSIYRRQTTAPYSYPSSGALELLFTVRLGFFNIDLVRRWHLAKGINSNTGLKTPTVFADSHLINYGVHPNQIVKINYRGVDYSESFNDSTDFYKYKLWRNDTGTTQYNQSPGRVVWPRWRAEDQADVESAIADGIICVEASANERAYIDLPTGPDYNNQIFFIEPNAIIRWPSYGPTPSYENFASWSAAGPRSTIAENAIIFFEGDGTYYISIGGNWVSITKNDIVSNYPSKVKSQYYNRGHGMTTEKVIVVSSISDKADGSVSPRSSRGPGIDIWAPSRPIASSHYPGSTPWEADGTGYTGSTGQLPGTIGYLPDIKIIKDNRNNNYFLVKSTDGTSFAQPHVSGVIGLWLEMKPNLTQAEVKSLLLNQGYSVTGTNTLTLDAAGVNHNYYDPTGVAGGPTLALGFSPPTFNISASTTSLNPGQTITYTVTTTNVPDGSTLYLKEAGTSIASDFVDGATQSDFVISNNKVTFSRTLSLSFIGTRTSILDLKTGGYDGTVQASTSTVNLTSPSVVSYRINPFTSTIGESKSITFTVYTTGVPSGTVLYYSLEGTATAADFSDNTLIGTVTIGATGYGYFTKTLINDNVSDNNESIVAKLYSNSSRSVLVASTSNYIIRTKEQNATYNLSASAGIVDEQNKNITFTLTTKNIPPSSTVPYQITGVSSADLSGSPSLTGNFTIAKPLVGKSNYNELGGWVFYPLKFIDGDVTDVFIRGNRVVVSEEVWWSGTIVNGVWTPTGPSGIASSGNSLKRVSDKYKTAGYVTGLSITPYCLTHRYRADLGSIEYNVPAISFNNLINEISQSGVSFVQLNPHLFTKSDLLSIYNGSLYWDETKLLSIINDFKNAVKGLGLEFYIVIQGWKQTGQTFTEVNNYNNTLLSLSNVDEFYVFGQEDGLDLADTQSLNNDLTETLTTSISFTTVPDSTTEGIETLTMTLTGQAVDKENTLLPFLASDVVTASVSILDSSTTAVPSYSLSRSVSAINEGQSVTITLTTSNVANGTSIPWTVTGISAGDLSSGSLTGNFVVGSVNTASFTLSNDTLTEGAETLNFALDNGQASITVVVNDTSTAPVPTYTLTNNSTNNRINEGQTVVFTLATTNVSAGTSIPWTVTGISAGDLSSGSLTGNFIVGTTDTASFTLSNDLTVEGTERLTLTLNGKTVSSYVDVIDTSTAPGAPTYALTNNVTSPISEGTVITFTLTTTNVSSGTLVPWEIRGTGGNPTDSADFTSAITGNFVINAAGVGTVSITVNNDIKTENTETFRFRLTNNVAIYNDISITDTSFPTLTYSLTSDKSSANEDESVTFYLEQTPYSSADSIQSYSVSGITSADLDTSFSAVLNGNFNLVNVGGVGKDSKTFKLKTDSLTEGAETFTLTLTGINRSESVSVTINDTSTTPGVSYSLSSNAVADTLNEGDSVTFHLGTSGVGSGVTLAYTVTGINAADLSSGTLTGNFSTNVNGGASVTFTLANDLKLEGPETLTLALNNGGASKSVTVQDTSFPTYTLSGAPAVSEGSSITITLTTTGLGNGDLVPYNISGINAADIDSASVNGLTGNFIINPTGSTPNVGTITITLANDLSTEGPETFYVNLNNGLAAPHAVTITDSSVAPPATPSYSLSASDYDVNEGDTVIFTLVTTNVTAGTNVPYIITGLNAADLTSGSISGNFVVGNTAPNQDQITIVVKADNFTEGVETLRLRITGTTEYVDVVVRDTSLTPAPTLPTYALTANSAVLREGESVVIVLSVTNLGVGVSVPYVISGISSADIDKPLSGGSFVINAAGKASVTLNAAADFTSEGTETLRLTIYGTANYIDIPIADVSTGFPTYSLSANSSTYNEGDTVVILLTTTSLPTGTSIPYTIVGVGPTDINGASLTGNFTTNAAGYANVVLTLTNDGILEGPEFLNVSLNGRSEFVTVYITDTSKPAESFRLASSATVVSEGSTVNVTLITTGIVQGTVVPYTLSGTLDATDYSNLSSGVFIINEYGNSTISLLVNKDFDVEGTETFIVTLTDRPQTNITILVNDFSYQVTVPASFTEVIPLPAPPPSPPPGFGTIGIESLGDALDKPSALVQKLLPEFARGG